MRRRLAALALAALLAACTGQGQEPGPSDDSQAVLDSRDALGRPMVALAEAAIALSEGIDTARHKTSRGERMKRQVDALPALQRDVRSAASDASQAAEQAPVEQAATIVRRAARQAERAAEAAGGEIGYLQRISRLDAALLDAAATWDEPGSQSEIRARLDALARDVGRLRADVRATPPRPKRCTVMNRNRLEWIDTVQERTRELQAQANSAGGGTFDRLRSSYRALPFAVEPRTADRQDRDCWTDRSAVAGVAPAMRDAVDRLEKALSG